MSILIFTVLLVLLAITGYFLGRQFYGDFGFFLTAISISILVVIYMSLPIVYYSTKAEIKSYYAVKETLDNARNSSEYSNYSIESAALQLKIIETNSWLATQQYWKQTILTDFIPDEIMILKPLK